MVDGHGFNVASIQGGLILFQEDLVSEFELYLLRVINLRKSVLCVKLHKKLRVNLNFICRDILTLKYLCFCVHANFRT